MPRPKVGLALSGGGARGLAHIGVLKVLLNAGIPIDCISGTSMGGIIAAAYACQVPISAIEERALKLSQMRELIKLIDLSPRRRGLLEGNRVRDFLVDLFLDRTFETIPVPLAIPAVDLLHAREVVFSQGLILPAVLATIAVPGLFKPFELGDYRLVDGGILNNLPVDLARKLGADVVIAVDAQFDLFAEKIDPHLLEPQPSPIPIPDFFLNFYHAELIMIARLTEERLKVCPPEILIRPPIPLDINMFLGFNRAIEIIAAGESCARQALPDILRLLG